MLMQNVFFGGGGGGGGGGSKRCIMGDVPAAEFTLFVVFEVSLLIIQV